MITLYEHSEKRIGDILRFEAKIHGATIKEPPKEGKKAAATKPKSLFEFGDPDAYKNMTQEERDRLTNQMMNRHQMWIMEKKPMGGKQARIG